MLVKEAVSLRAAVFGLVQSPLHLPALPSILEMRH